MKLRQNQTKHKFMLKKTQLSNTLNNENGTTNQNRRGMCVFSLKKQIFEKNSMLKVCLRYPLSIGGADQAIRNLFFRGYGSNRILIVCVLEECVKPGHLKSQNFRIFVFNFNNQDIYSKLLIIHEIS